MLPTPGSLEGKPVPTVTFHFTEITQDRNINGSVLRAVRGRLTWPQVFIGGKLIGNADALDAYFGAARAA